MTPCTNNQYTHREGVVLMELVLSLSLFLVLVGGTMWIGELYLARTKLMIADRFAVWNGANRHMGNPGALQGTIQQEFFPAARVGSQHVSGITWERGPADRWYTPFGATVYLEATMPVWTEGWLAAGVTWDSPNSPEPVRAFTGRESEAAPSPSHSVLVARTRYGAHPNAHRNWKPIELLGINHVFLPANSAAVWNLNVWRLPWPTLTELQGSSSGGVTQTPASPSRPNTRKYERHSQYETWSQ